MPVDGRALFVIAKKPLVAAIGHHSRIVSANETNLVIVNAGNGVYHVA